MASENRSVFAGGVLAVAATAVLVYFGTGLFPRWPLLWFAPLPVLLFAQRSSWLASGGCAFLGWGLGVLNMQHYFAMVLHAPVAVQIGIFATPALVFAFSVLLFRGLVRRGALWSALLGPPAAYTTCEYLLNLSSPHGTWGSLAYSQLNFLPFLQFASITGPWGMTFFLLIFSSGLAIALGVRKTNPPQAFRILGVSWGAIAAILIFGSVRLASPPRGPMVKVGLVASDAPGNTDVADEGAETDRLLRDYAVQARALAAHGAQVIVLPEKLGVIMDSNKGEANAVLQSVADETNDVLVVGVVEVSPRASYNQARVYIPGAAPQTYNKRHMLPPFESRFQPGTTLTTLYAPRGIWGVEICKDMDFTPLSREYGQRGAGLMLVPAWDFVLDRIAHGHMAIMRGVEDGFSIARAARQGYLTVADNRGRILAETQSNASSFTTLLAEVPAAHDNTVYLVLGDSFGWLAVATFILTCLQLFRTRENPGGRAAAASSGSR